MFVRIALTVLMLLPAASSDAQEVARQVLLLQSIDRGNLAVDQFTGNFRVELDKRAEQPVNVVQVVVGPTGSVGASDPAVVDYILSTFARRPKPDLIVSIAGPAAVFARKYRQRLFPETPILFASVDQRYLGEAPFGLRDAAVPVLNDYPRIIEDILQVLPQTRQVFVVTGSGQVGRFWHRELEVAFKQFQNRLTFSWFDDLSLEEMLRRCASLPDNSAIVYVTFGTDTTGAAYADERVFAELRERANAPLFAGQSAYLGAGVVGGTMLAIDDLSRDTADVAVRLLNGAPPASLRIPPQRPRQPIFDWRELQRWGIAESRLPVNSIVRYRAPSLWQEHKGTVLSAVGVLAIQSLLIGGLLYQRRARQKAEIESRRNLTLAADASRRQTMSALTSSIAHELSQPLSAMIHNAQAGQGMLTAKRATPDTLGEILSDIESGGIQAIQIIERLRAMLRTQQLHKVPIDLHAVIDESLALVHHEMRARGVDVVVNRSSTPCIVTGDQVLLQQVLVNLVMNAMDAMAEAPAARRRVTIRTEVVSGHVKLSVGDAGTGLPVQIQDTLFTAFVTTKAHGLGVGLAIARTIVEAHGGTIEGRNNSGEGATFTVTLRCSERQPSPRVLLTSLEGSHG